MAETLNKIPVRDLPHWDAFGLFVLGKRGSLTGTSSDPTRVIRVDDVLWDFPNIRRLLMNTVGVDITDIDSAPRAWIVQSVNALGIEVPKGWGK